MRNLNKIKLNRAIVNGLIIRSDGVQVYRRIFHQTTQIMLILWCVDRRPLQRRYDRDLNRQRAVILPRKLQISLIPPLERTPVLQPENRSDHVRRHLLGDLLRHLDRLPGRSDAPLYPCLASPCQDFREYRMDGQRYSICNKNYHSLMPFPIFAISFNLSWLRLSQIP